MQGGDGESGEVPKLGREEPEASQLSLREQKKKPVRHEADAGEEDLMPKFYMMYMTYVLIEAAKKTTGDTGYSVGMKGQLRESC